MPTKRQILARWKKLAGDVSPQAWTDEASLVGLFESFRPRGQGLEALLEDVERGDEVLPRLRQVFKAAARSEAPFFLPTPIRATTPAAAERLIRRHLKSLAAMASAVGDDELVALLSSDLSVTFVRGDLPTSKAGESIESQLRDLVSDFQTQLKPVRSHASLLVEALYSMADTYVIPDYVLWPLYRDRSPVEEPFAAAFELWKRGVEFTFQSRRFVLATISPSETAAPAVKSSRRGSGTQAVTAAPGDSKRGRPFPSGEVSQQLRASRDYDDDEFYLSKIEKGLKEKPLDLRYVARFLAGLGRPISTRGLVEVLDGNPSGWEQVFTGWKYLAWQYRAETAEMDGALATRRKIPTDSEGVHLDKAALCLSGAIALGQDAFADWCGDRLMRNFTKGDPLVRERNWNSTPFEPFMIRLYAKWRGREEQLLANGLDELVGKFPKQDRVFHPVLDAWDDPKKFEKTFLSLCDAYCDSLGTRFRPLPFCVFPSDIVALARIRRDLELDDPSHGANWFSAGIACPPAGGLGDKPDRLFERVVAACGKAYPKLPLAWQW